jgi:hypothetical protein
VDHGAHVEFAAHFGSDCPTPDFASARARYDDDDQLRPAFVTGAPPRSAPLRKRDVARDASLLCAIAFATSVFARALSRRGVGAGLP